MNCHEFEENIAAFVDGKLEGELLAAMTRHRDSCSTCGRLSDVHDFVLASLDNAEPVMAPYWLKSRIISAVDAYETETSKEAVKQSVFGIRAAAFAAVGSLIAAMLPISKLLVKRFPDIILSMERMNKTDESLVTIEALWNTIRAQASIMLLFLQNQFAGIRIPEQWLQVMNIIAEPVQIPYLSFSMPPYVMGAFVILSGISWYYMNTMSLSAAGEQYYSA